MLAYGLKAHAYLPSVLAVLVGTAWATAPALERFCVQVADDLSAQDVVEFKVLQRGLKVLVCETIDGIFS